MVGSMEVLLSTVYTPVAVVSLVPVWCLKSGVERVGECANCEHMGWSHSAGTGNALRT